MSEAFSQGSVSAAPTDLQGISMGGRVTQAAWKTRVLYVAGLAMILYAAFAFLGASWAQPFRFERFIEPLVTVHIFAGLSWLILFASQTRLITRDEIDRHRRRMGLAIVIVLILVGSSVFITYRVGFAARVLGESRDALAFAILFAAALLHAKNGDVESHKRLMFIASLNLINPANMRMPMVFDWPPYTSLPFTLFAWVVVPIGYDLLTERKIHKATVFGVGFTLVTFTIVVAVIFSPLMTMIEVWLYGPDGNRGLGLPPNEGLKSP